jgi:hypothetical protein
MEELLEQRLLGLRAEFEAGRDVIAELDAKQANIRSTLLRISGAIQVLEELLKSKVEKLRREQTGPTDETRTVQASAA